MADADHQRIQERAYQIWLREGRPHGRDLDHWNQAEQELSKEYHSAPQQSQAKQPAATLSHVDSPSGATPAAAGTNGAAKKRTRGKLKDDPEAKTEGKPSKKQAGERAVREPPRK